VRWKKQAQVDNSRINVSSISRTVNGVSEWDVQIFTIKNIYVTINKYPKNRF